MVGQTTTLRIHLSGADPQDLESFHLAVRGDASQLENVNVEVPPAKGAPARVKAAPGLDWHTILVTFAASGGVLTTLLGIIQAYLTRQRSVTLEMDGDKLTISGASDAQQQRLIESWVSRHRRPVKVRG